MVDVTPLPTAPAAFVLFYAKRLFVAENPHPRPADNTVGWRAWVWTEDPGHAMKWSTQEGAEKFAREWLVGPYAARPVYPSGIIGGAA